MTKNVSTVLALSAAALFLGACDKDKAPTSTPDASAPSTDAAATDAADAADGGMAADASDTKIKCFGVNECKGQAACDVPDGRVAEGSKGHSCAGQNECKGKGWISLSQAECDEKGGEPV